MAESSVVAQTLIRWRLNEVMARHDIRAKELAEEMEVSQSAISNLRKRSMPRLSEETLDKLCRALNKLSQEKTTITPGDLIEYIPDLETLGTTGQDNA
jgi:putative transcriptional regulator